MRFLLIAVICICIRECYWPIPDRDKEKFNRYKHVPIEDIQLKAECIYFSVSTPQKLKVYLNNRPVLNAGEKKIINKFKIWLNETEKN